MHMHAIMYIVCVYKRSIYVCVCGEGHGKYVYYFMTMNLIIYFICTSFCVSLECLFDTMFMCTQL